MAGMDINVRDFMTAYVRDLRYRDYMVDKAEEINRAARSMFLLVQRKDNEWRLSVTTPPKYVESFRAEVDVRIQTSYAINSDPAWNMVVWGAHPGGDPDTFVLAYKPMTRGLELVASLHRQPR